LSVHNGGSFEGIHTFGLHVNVDMNNEHGRRIRNLGPNLKRRGWRPPSPPSRRDYYSNSVLHFHRRAHGLTDILEQLSKPLRLDVERLATFDAFKLDCA
jgi:hypothetical protein